MHGRGSRRNSGNRTFSPVRKNLAEPTLRKCNENNARRTDYGRLPYRNGRPAFDALCRDATTRQFDVVMAWNVDRLGRSLKDLVAFLSELPALGIDLFLHQQGLDTTTPAGKAMFQMLGVFAEFERSIIQERVRAGLLRAKREGKRLGRPPIAEKLAERIRAALAGGMSVRKTAAKFEVNPSTVQRIARPFGGAEDASVAA